MENIHNKINNLGNEDKSLHNWEMVSLNLVIKKGFSQEASGFRKEKRTITSSNNVTFFFRLISSISEEYIGVNGAGQQLTAKGLPEFGIRNLEFGI